MNPIIQALQSLGINLPSQKVISPLPKTDSPGGINDPTQSGLNYYYQREYQGNQITPQQAMASIKASQPQTVQYPSWMANAPEKNTQQVLSAQTQQPQGFDINSIGQALQTLTKSKPQLPQSQASNDGSTQGDFLDKVNSYANQYGLPPGIAQGVWAMEGRGKTINPNNPYNLGAIDTNPQNANAYKFSSPLQGAQEAIKFLAGQSPYQTDQVKTIFRNALTQYKKDHNTAEYMNTISPIYSTKSDYAQTVMNTPEYRQYAKKN